MLWTQNQTLELGAVTPQETQDLSQEIHDQPPQILLAGCSLAELSLAELSLAELSLAELSLAELSLDEPSHDQLAEYDWWI